jgi:glycosyltransferase involved in cell wall biosynthesis
VSSPRVSVIVRSKDSAETIGATFRSLANQSVRPEIVVVDSGSTDRTLEIARAWTEQIVEIPASDFSFGRALNVGARAGTAPILCALSSHTTAPSEHWIERCLHLLADENVAAASGMRYTSNGVPLVEPETLTAARIAANPYWGFSNTASCWRRSLWERFPYNEEIEACEDKEWSLRVTQAGFTVVIDPRLTPSQLHRRRAGTAALFARSRREARALGSVFDLRPMPFGEMLNRWWNGLPEELAYPPLFYRLNYYRAAEIAGVFVGQREGRRRAPRKS